MKSFVVLSFFILLPCQSFAMLYATLKGHENDVKPDGRNLHVIVAGYGGEMGTLTYEMAVSRAKKLKQNFPNDRIVILGSTSFQEGTVNHLNTPTRLEQKYDISIPEAYKSERYGDVSNMPLTSNEFTGTLLLAISDIKSYNEFKKRHNGNFTFEDVYRGLKSGEIKQRGSIRSIDFMTHSSPQSGIHLHNDTKYYRRLSASEARGLKIDGKTVIQDEKGNVYRATSVDTSQRALSANSKNIQALNGFFTDDAYVNMAGCSGGYGVVNDLSKVLGVPVSGTANGSEVYVMDKEGNFYYDYSVANPHERVPLSQSAHSALGHDLSASDLTAPMALRPGLRTYSGYWGDLRSGTNFPVTSCNVRSGNKDDLDRCEMGMARKIEDSITETTVREHYNPEDVSNANKKFKYYLEALKETMCPNGEGLSPKYKPITEKCNRAIDVLAVLNMNCGFKTQDLNNATSGAALSGKAPVKYKDACAKYADEYIKDLKDFVPLHDDDGKTLVCDLNGCKVKLKNCDITENERKDCWSQTQSALADSLNSQQVRYLNQRECYASDSAPFNCLVKVLCANCASSDASKAVESNKNYKAFKTCMNKKRCEIDEKNTQASNKGNYTFMQHIQHYINGFITLEQYRRGDMQFLAGRPKPDTRGVKTEVVGTDGLSDSLRRAIESGEAVGLY